MRKYQIIPKQRHPRGSLARALPRAQVVQDAGRLQEPLHPAPRAGLLVTAGLGPDSKGRVSETVGAT